MKLLIMQFSPTFYYFFVLGPNIIFSTPFSDIFSLCSSFKSETEFHIRPTTSEFIVMYILIFTCLDSRREDRRFWTEW
jgi:hypothetical protein